MFNSKFSEYAPANSAAAFPSSSKNQPKKTALINLENGNRVMLPSHPGIPLLLKNRGPFMETSMISGIERPTNECSQHQPGIPLLLKNRGPFMETSMISGIERPTNDCSQSLVCHESPMSSGANRHLVYARRKSEQEQLPKGIDCAKENNTDCPEQSQKAEKMSQRQAQSVSAVRPYLSAFKPVSATSPMATSGGASLFPAKLSIELSPGEPNHGTNDSGVSRPGNWHRMNDPDQPWKERFLKLQTHLRNSDLSTDQEYIKMLQSLTPEGRSKLAVELEKRAIRLLMEEGQELMRMKHLNVLGKSVPKNYSSPLAKRFKTEE